VIFGCEQPELAENFPRTNLLVQVRQPVSAGDGDEHLLGNVTLAKEYLACAIFSPGHERLQPVHRQVSGGRCLHLPDETKHLKETKAVERHEQTVQKNSRHRARENARTQETQPAGNARNAQWNEGLAG
jgi:hypothetical protein